ncbi:MAG: glycosyltransferase family 2 protein [Alistipes sp.]|nr:glycosyltransferase family 2 protein [Alistipes sp.]
MERNKISVIVPIYKVEAFIERCVVSLMEQTLDSVEYLFVDDASPDNSVRILQEVINRYPNRLSQVKIITHSENEGLPAARNTGLAKASGEYIFHCDSDDFVELDMLEKLYNKAKEIDADIVWCDFFLTFEKNERYMKQPNFETSMDALKAMLSGAMKYNVWNKLVKRSLYTDNKIAFPAGYGMGEDMTMMMLYANAQTVAYIPRAFYHYVKLNIGAFSQTYSERHLVELKHNVERVTNYIQDIVGDKLEQELAFFKLDVKFPFLITDDVRKYRMWREWYPEADKYIGQNKKISARSQALQWLASKGQFWAVRLYYILIYKLIYGVIYK